ncbi:MAG: nucleotidyl transferase AbiEii/AbiGii toxin family protein [Gemmatimonadota bacterium]
MGGDGFTSSLPEDTGGEGQFGAKTEEDGRNLITEGYLARHYRGRSGGRDYALLDVAQDYALKILSDTGLFELGLTFRGGTALRKYRAGNLGRFSTDLDFSCSDPALGQMALEALDGAELFEVEFQTVAVTPGRRAKLSITTPLGSPGVDALLEVSPRDPWLRPEIMLPVDFPVHRGYEFTQVPVPVMAFEETLAEKLAAFRRRVLARDLYDLNWFARPGAFDEELVRRLTYLKVYVDVVEEDLGSRPFNPERDLFNRDASDFLPEDIGLLAGELRIEEWLEAVGRRFRFLSHPVEDEVRWARCDPRDAGGVSEAIEQLSNTCNE